MAASSLLPCLHFNGAEFGSFQRTKFAAARAGSMPRREHPGPGSSLSQLGYCNCSADNRPPLRWFTSLQVFQSGGCGTSKPSQPRPPQIAHGAGEGVQEFSSSGAQARASAEGRPKPSAALKGARRCRSPRAFGASADEEFTIRRVRGFARGGCVQQIAVSRSL